LWVVAIDAWDYGFSGFLAEKIRTEPIPEELRPIIADIVSGQRKLNKRRIAKSKIEAERRMLLASELSCWLRAVEWLKTEASGIADKEGIEPIDVTRRFEAKARKELERRAAEHGVSVETIENLLRDMRAKLANYPNV
jgi:hypothetical protein